MLLFKSLLGSYSFFIVSFESVLSVHFSLIFFSSFSSIVSFESFSSFSSKLSIVIDSAGNIYHKSFNENYILIYPVLKSNESNNIPLHVPHIPMDEHKTRYLTSSQAAVFFDLNKLVKLFKNLVPSIC